LISCDLEFNWLLKPDHVQNLSGMHYKLHGFGISVCSGRKWIPNATIQFGG